MEPEICNLENKPVGWLASREGMLDANLIGFQSPEYCLHFLQTPFANLQSHSIVRVEATPTGVRLEDRFVDVAALPIGIDSHVLWI